MDFKTSKKLTKLFGVKQSDCYSNPFKEVNKKTFCLR